MATEDNLRKALTFFFVAVGLWIFYVVVMTKLEVMTEETKAKVLRKSAEDSFEDFLYQKTVDSIAEEKNSREKE